MRQRFVCRIDRTALIQRLRRIEVDLERLLVLAQLQVKVRDLGLHRGIIGIEVEHLFEDAGCLFALIVLEVLIGYCGVLRTRVVVQTLLGVQLGQADHRIQRARIQLCQLLIDSYSFDDEAV